MEKKIYFCVDYASFANIKQEFNRLNIPYNECDNYHTTKVFLKYRSHCIVTNSIAHLSFDLIELGYDIYLCYKDNRVKIEPHMQLNTDGSPCKDIRMAHNILRLFLAGVFDDILGINKYIRQ
jgi:hypothetical protein